MSETITSTQPESGYLEQANIESVVTLARPDSPWRRVFRRYLRNRMAVLSVFVLAGIILIALFASHISRHSPYSTNLRAIRNPPSAEHILGTDIAGRDVFSRVVHGARISLIVGLGSVGIYIIFGTVLGLISGYFGGLIDTIIMRLTDAMMSLPTLLIVLMLVTITQPSLVNIIIAIAVSRWPGITRLVRGQVLSVKTNEYVTAAQALGASSIRLMFRHLLPNILAPLIVAASFGVASAILAEAALSFLGLGVRPPEPSWGTMLNEAQSLSVLADLPWFWIPPGFMIAVSVLCINFIGDGIRDALDPRMKEV